ncbi:MAG: octanoyltransferase [Gammaproteobacteria bacterium RIFCSPHIGHO2_12_FULL_42_10]|nr:MAG: octanoyltransferase [Gammaproteobacteria bacterium RIFCSPHIGHO2_12_FULL_42_10]
MYPPLIIRSLGRKDYVPCLAAMQQYTACRNADSPDEIWLLEHPPVFTQGQNGKAEHILQPGDIPIINIDRGGQVTYHGPGQLMIYSLIDIQRKKFKIRQFVDLLLQAVIDLLATYNVNAYTKSDAPGIYVDHKKICSIGLRIKKGCAYHGMAFNVAMDLEPFSRINPCGFTGLKMTQLSDYLTTSTICLEQTGRDLIPYLVKHLEYTQWLIY